VITGPCHAKKNNKNQKIRLNKVTNGPRNGQQSILSFILLIIVTSLHHVLKYRMARTMPIKSLGLRGNP
jgi:hypothetical protein